MSNNTKTKVTHNEVRNLAFSQEFNEIGQWDKIKRRPWANWPLDYLGSL